MAKGLGDEAPARPRVFLRYISAALGRKHAELAVTRRELFLRAAENRLIDDMDLWMSFHAARNETSHTYDTNTAEEVCASPICPSASMSSTGTPSRKTSATSSLLNSRSCNIPIPRMKRPPNWNRPAKLTWRGSGMTGSFSTNGAAYISPGQHPGYASVLHRALKGRHNGCHAPSGLGSFGDRKPRALPWAGVSRPIGAAEGDDNE